MKKTLLLFAILLVVAGTRGFAQQDSTKQHFPVMKAEVRLNDSLPALLLQNQKPLLWENRYDWISYQMKVSVKTEEEDLAFQCFFVNRTDSLIYLNLHKSGIELARVVLTPDSVTIVNKLQKEYYKGGYEVFVKMLGFPLTFPMVQSLMNGRDFIDCEGPFSTMAEGQQIKYIWPQRQCGDLMLMQEILSDSNGVLLRNELTELTGGRNAAITYDNPRLETMNFNPDGDEPRMDSVMVFDGITVHSDSQGLSLKATLSKLRVNVPGPTSVKIPDSFTPIIFLKVE